MGFREPGQHDDEWRRYRVCWTEVNRLRCQKRTIAAGAWDDLRLPLVPSLGTTASGHRVADVTWFVDGAKVAARRVRLGDQ